MGQETHIEWCDHTFNYIWGCTKVSAGCDNCYAATLSKRFGGDIWGPTAPRRFFGEKHWNEPRKWDKEAAKAGVRRKVFCASMADVFESRKDLDRERLKLWALIEETPNLDWLLLTKRPHNIARMLPKSWQQAPLKSVWLGTSVENDAVAVRAERLCAVPAVVHFLSLEPLIGPVTKVDMRTISWGIIGGESGHGARRMEPQWVDDIIDQCRAAGTAVFFKQKGSVLARSLGCSDPKGGDVSEPNFPDRWKVREFPQVPA